MTAMAIRFAANLDRYQQRDAVSAYDGEWSDEEIAAMALGEDD